ncbi:MAG: S8 family serine peptidase [candidate division WOR-3 bacterium]|nr:MAG: S8 family serine peptidase [candidate division WOR-3 bacterium]
MLIILFMIGAMYQYRAPLQDKVDPRCYSDEYVKAWVYFTDKNVTAKEYDAAVRAAARRLTDAAIRRRAMRKGVTDYADIPVYAPYVREVEENGGLLVEESRWLNAASFYIARDDIDRIARLASVYKITKVAPFRAPDEESAVVQDTAIYGLTYRQSQMFGIDRVHEMGIFGSDVRVGFLDTGLRRTHLALSNVNVVAEHDFLGGDQIFMNNDAVTVKYGTYSDLVFHRTGSRYNLFLAGDTVQYGDPVRDLLYTYSTDNGVTWQDPVVTLTNYYNNWVRELDVCGRDTMYVFFRDRFGLKYIVHTDSMLVEPMGLGTPGSREITATMWGDTVYVAYHRKDSDSDTTFLFLNRGVMSGFTQESAIDTSLSSIQAPKIVSCSTAIGVFYHIFPEDSLYFIKSSMVPATFTTKFTTRGKDAETITYGDTIFAIWKDVSSEPLFRVAFALSTDFGETFTNPTYLSDDLNAIGKISLARVSNAIKVSWEAGGKIYSTTSYDQGAHFGIVDSLPAQFVYLPTITAPAGEFINFYCMRGDAVTDGYASTDPNHFHPRHGTEMLALVGGYFTARYIGVAPGARFIVAKTENPDTNYEFPVEEDTYIAGLEWCESQGADIVSSSLGYTAWYSWPRDYDGKTSPSSIAAYEATKRGVVVVTAAGNIAAPRIEIPGDAMGVITVGGIDSLYNRWEFSGYGPTFDGRRKPEIMCLSAAPIVVDPDSVDSYLYSFGTSGATAMVAGICALLLEAHPSWNVDSIREALFTTASMAAAPTDSMGFGWPDVYAAIHYSPIEVDTTQGCAWLDPFPNPFYLNDNEYIRLPFRLDRQSPVELRIYSMTGRLIMSEERMDLMMPGTYTDDDAFIWDGTDEDGNDVPSGIYYCVLNTFGAGNDVVKFAVVK